MRAALVSVLLAGAVVAAAWSPPSASALTCALQRPARMLAAADAAFVGRLTEARADRWVFVVERAVKGNLGAQVEIPRPAVPVSAMFTPRPGERTGLVLDRAPDGSWTVTDCSRLAPEALEAAAADPDATCWRPQVRAVRFRLPGRVDVALGGLDDPATTVTVAWGDGSSSTRRLGAGPPRRTVVLRHRYRERGRMRVKVAVAGRPVAACGSQPERAAARTMVVRVPRA